MQQLDWIVLALFFLVMVVIGMWSYKQIATSGDFYVAGGKLPWWLSGISHHISGYSGVVFVAYAGIAYTHGFTIYMWWALPVSVAVLVGSFIIAPRWARLRINQQIESPTEYLCKRYNLPTQQLMAWSGVLLKLFDVGAKWAAIAILLRGFTGIPLIWGVLLAGGISLIYITVGGLWADIWTDLAQFIVQIIAGFAMFFIVLNMLGGIGGLSTLWDDLPAEHANLFSDPYTELFAVAFLIIAFFSYNGGTWNLATRYISSPTGSDARKAALLSGALYLVWPLILFFPMWAAPVILGDVANPEESYALLTQELLPPGLVGLVLAAMFASTMSMTSSDANTISAVITRDILPTLSERMRRLQERRGLLLARAATFGFTAATLVIAINEERFGGVIGLIVSWFAALVGPVSIPMILGLLPAFRHAGAREAIVSILGGFTGFVVVNYAVDVSQAVELVTPIAVSFVLFFVMSLLNRGKQPPADVTELMRQLQRPAPGVDETLPS